MIEHITRQKRQHILRQNLLADSRHAEKGPQGTRNHDRFSKWDYRLFLDRYCPCTGGAEERRDEKERGYRTRGFHGWTPLKNVAHGWQPRFLRWQRSPHCHQWKVGLAPTLKATRFAAFTENRGNTSSRWQSFSDLALAKLYDPSRSWQIRVRQQLSVIVRDAPRVSISPRTSPSQNAL